jgi:hypothetical protein
MLIEKQIQLFLEELARTNLKDWNAAQKHLWSKLTKEGYVKKNDFVKFKLFAKIFSDYAEEHGRKPSVNYIKKRIL